MKNKISGHKKINIYMYEQQNYSWKINNRFISIWNNFISISGKNYFWYTIKSLWKSKIIVKINEYWAEQHIRNSDNKDWTFKNYKEAIEYFIENKQYLSRETNDLIESTGDQVEDALCY